MPNARLPAGLFAFTRPVGQKGWRGRALGVLLLAGALATGPGTAAGQPPEPTPATTQAPALPLTATPNKPEPGSEGGAASSRQPIADLALSTLAGGRVVFSGLLKGEPPKRALVVAITSATCPISKRYAARIAGLEAEFAESAAFVYVNPVDGESVEQMRESIRAYGFKGPYVVDAAGEVRKAMRPVTTTEVYVLTSDLRVAYRGAVDDQYRLGGAAAQATERYLRDAIVAVVGGKEPAVKATSAPGCLIELPPEPQPAKAPVLPGGAGAGGVLEYYPQVAAIVEKSCVSCHRLGGPAPFSLESPGAVRGRGRMIEAVIGAGIMPPNHAPRGVGLADPGRVMTAADKDLLSRWLNSARAVGVSTEAPPARAALGNTWMIGLPDLILTSQGITLAAEGPMRMTRQLVPVNIDADRLVEKVECRPVMPDSIENAIVWLVEPGEAVPTAGVTIPAGRVLGTYSPGDSVWASALSGGVQRLRAGSVLVVDSYARPMGRATTSQLRVALKFAAAAGASGEKQPVVRTMIVSASGLDIGAGTREARASATMKLDKPVRLLAVQPVMRSRGRQFTVGVKLASGERLALIELGRFDWRWQIRYPLARPLELAAGSTIELSGVFDNSAENHFNPDATRAVRLGPDANDETLMAIIEVLVSE